VTAAGCMTFGCATRGGKEYSTTFETKRAAETFETTERAAKFRGGWVDPRRAAVRVADVADAWLDSDPAKRHSSAARDRSILDRHVLSSLGSKPVGSVTPADLQKLVNAWSTSYAPSTVGRHYSCMRAMFSYAEAAEIIVRSPCRNIRLPHVDLVDRPVVSPAVLEQLADTLGPNTAPMMWLGAVLGLRWAECAGLRVGRVDFLRSTLTVAEQLGRDGRTGPPKSSAGRRTLAVPGG
jgi:integrase